MCSSYSLGDPPMKTGLIWESFCFGSIVKLKHDMGTKGGYLHLSTVIFHPQMDVIIWRLVGTDVM